MRELEYAGFWIRVAAALVDLVIVTVVIYTPLFMIYGAQYGTQMVHGFWDLVLGWVLPVVAVTVMWVTWRATPGKMALRLEVVDAESGENLTAAQALGRYLAYIPASFIFLLGIIWVGIDRRKQGWHDKMAGTVVVRRRAPDAVSFGGE